MGSIVCEECGNMGTVEMIIYGGKPLNNLKKYEIFVGGKRFFKAYYHAICKELDYMPSYAEFNPSLKEHQIIYARALKETGMIGEITNVRSWNEQCFRCSMRPTPLSLSILPVLLPAPRTP